MILEFLQECVKTYIGSSIVSLCIMGGVLVLGFVCYLLYPLLYNVPPRED